MKYFNNKCFIIRLLGFLSVLLQSFCSIRAEIHYYDFVLREKNYTRLCSTKSMLVVNDSFPGPEIRVRKGDTIFVNVHNQGYYGVTIHWHGVRQPRNPWSDGPEYITQCPIEAGSNFTYEVAFSTEEGTLWWHAHSDWTRATVHGAIVIHPSEGTTFPYPKPDGEQVLVLAAWYTGNIKELVDEAMEDGSDLPHSDAYTINGQPGDFCACSKDTTYRWKVDYGKTYLLRIINAVTNAEMFFAVAGHNLTVVGTDGAYVKPFSTSYIVMSPGETMDILLAADQAPGKYYIGTRQYSSRDATVTGFDYANVTAILQYVGGDDGDFSSSPIYPTNLPMYLDIFAWIKFTNEIKSLASREYPVNVPLEVTTRMYITASMNIIFCPNSSCSDGSDKLGSSLNNVSWVNPSTDVLLAYYRKISGVYTTDFLDWPPTMYNFTGEISTDNISLTIQGRKVKMLNYNEAVEIVFQGTNVLKGSVNHPMHFHGHSFYVVGRGFGNFDFENDPKDYNLVDPPQVNTFSIPKNGWVAIRFVANNPGVWYWHCHLARHQSWGMDTVFIVKNGGTPETSLREPPPYMPPCAADSSISWL